MSAILLTDAARCGVYSLAVVEAKNLQIPPGFVHCHINLAGLKSKSAVLNKIGRALKFPQYYGKNFDALNDCLTDLEWLPANGYVFFIDGAQAFHAADPKNHSILLEVLQSAAEAWRDAGKPFWVLLDMALPEVRQLVV